ncbi:MAG: DUF721 domain-containing protein [Zoogloeaceae bacterium]|jgi:hypothetical protein|nr:DUF721 domain-containing protein [Zoogloeaceae bacterium]
MICKVAPPVFSPETLLERSDLFAGLLARARTLARLGKIFAAAAPVGLATQARVANHRRGVVILHASNGAVASKLRQLTPRLAEKFVQNGFECNQIEVKVQPTRREAILPLPGTLKPLSHASAEALTRRIRALPPASPLAEALKRLLERAEIREKD